MIVKMDCFEDCVKLQKLYLEHNQISKLEGLRNCTSLRELYIGN
jgi:Leucine-rich repeat (LRR) protein